MKDYLILQLSCIRNLPKRTKKEINYYNKCLIQFPGKHDLEYAEYVKDSK